jgi:LysR family transcriptional regulator, glycine cleavage system transcriptional activator
LLLRSILGKLNSAPAGKLTLQKLSSMRALQAFEAFGRLGSATAAATELGVTVGAISQQLRKPKQRSGCGWSNARASRSP